MAGDVVAQTQSAVTETGTAAPPELSAEKMMMDNLLILGMLFFIFYFVLIRPQQKRLKTHQAMMKSLAKGNKIITTGGIIGVVSKLEGEEVLLVEVAPNVKLRIARAAVSEILNEKAPASDAANDA